jgi:hypothetical protein
MGHIKDMCWKKNNKGPYAFAKFFKVMVNDKETTLVEFNCLYGVKHNIFFGIKMPKRKLHVQALIFGKGSKEIHEDESKEARIDGSIRSKVLSHFVKGKKSLTTMETILIVLGELEYLEGLGSNWQERERMLK